MSVYIHVRHAGIVPHGEKGSESNLWASGEKTVEFNNVSSLNI